jgi:hypothetical protein
MNLEIRRLIRDIDNPDYDRRAPCRARSVRVLLTDTKIILRREQENAGDVAFEMVSFRTVPGVAGQTEVYFSRRDFVRQVVAASSLEEPTSFKEFMMVNDEEDFTANRIMERLFQHPQGRLLIEAALKAEQSDVDTVDA